MRSPWIYGKNLIVNVLRKTRYGRRFHAAIVQSYDRLRVEITDDGAVTLGACGQGRGDTFLIAAGGRITIGEHVYLGPECYIAAMEAVSIGDHCKIGPYCSITDHDHDFRGDMESNYRKAAITIGAHTWIGANCTIVKGAHIGAHCVIAAGSIVRGEVPDGTMYLQQRETRICTIARGEAAP